MEPADGTALSTEYALTASGFADDEEDYPLLYSFFAYTKPASLQVLKSASEVKSVETKLGIGVDKQFAVVSIRHRYKAESRSCV